MNKKKFCKIFFPILGVALLVAGIYWAVIEFVLKDYQNLAYISFKYEQNEDEKSGVTLTGVYKDLNYPSYFEVPSKVLGRPIVGIDDSAFYGLDRLETIVLPSSVTTIGDNAFGNCPNLKRVIVRGEIESVGTDIFEGSNNWEGFETDNEFIMFEKFLYKCKDIIPNNSILKSEANRNQNESGDYNYVYIPNDIKGLCSGSFKDQSGLVGVEIPSQYTVVEKDSFSGCVNLKSVILNNVTEIGNNAFSGCTSLENIDLAKVELIGQSAFNGTNLTTVTLSNKVNNIGASTFANCSNLSELIIPDSVTRIDNYAFENDVSLTHINLSNNVEFLGVGVFKNTRIAEFTFPSKITTIQSELFMNDEALRNVNLPSVEERVDEEGNSSFSGIRTIGNYAFYNTSSLTSITFPKSANEVETIVEIRESAFEGSGLTSITIPSTITRLDRATFKNCVDLEVVDFGDNPTITTINAECFMGDVKLQEMIFPDTISSMQNAVLSGCTNLIKVSLPHNNGYKTINNSFFEGCENLESVIIPNNVVALRDRVFMGCSNLKQVQMLGRYSTIGRDVFSGCDVLETIYIGNNYQPSSGWTENWVPEHATLYYYSENEQAGYWHFVDDNTIAIW